MSPEPIRDYVGEALVRPANGNASASAFDANSGGDDVMSAANGTDFKGGGFQSKASGAMPTDDSGRGAGFLRFQPANDGGVCLSRTTSIALPSEIRAATLCDLS